MKGLFRREPFIRFGPCLLSSGEPELFTGPKGRAARLRACVRRDVPRIPGVYGMVDVSGELIYIGKAKSLRSRLMTYFQKGREAKAARIMAETRQLVWEPAPCEFAAVLRELSLIRRWRPRWNVAGQPRRQRRMYVCIGRKPAPHVFSAGRPPRTALHAFGPFPGMRRTADAVNRLNDWFRLRDCPQKQTMHFAGQSELFPIVRVPGCVRHDIGHCLAPCAAACTRTEYASGVDGALSFLHGADDSPVATLQRMMNEAAAAQEYERAAALRDRLRPLEWLWKHLDRLREARRVSGVYSVANHDETVAWYAIRHAVVRLRLAAGEVEAARRVLLSGPTDPGPAGLDEVDSLLLVAGWFRRHRAEREKLMGVDSLESPRPTLL